MKKYLFGIVGVVVFTLIFTTFSSVRAGWLWGGSEQNDTNGVGVAPDNANVGSPDGDEVGFGWISLNNTDCDTNDDGLVDVTTCGVVGTPIAKYGISIPTGDEAYQGGEIVDGYAWTEHYGWIDFHSSEHCVAPLTPLSIGQYHASSCVMPSSSLKNQNWVSREEDNLVGWARVVSIAQQSAVGNSGGWDGWISMSSSTGGGSIPYGVTVSDTGELSGYAWSEELGWLNIQGGSDTRLPKLLVCPERFIFQTQGQEKQVTAHYFDDASGNEGCSTAGYTNVTDNTEWSSDNPSSISIDDTGIVTAVDQGSAKITGEYQGLTDTSNGFFVFPTDDGKCGSLGCQKTLDENNTSLCESGSVIEFTNTGTGWTWKCTSAGSGAVSGTCSASKCGRYFREVAP